MIVQCPISSYSPALAQESLKGLLSTGLLSGHGVCVSKGGRVVARLGRTRPRFSSGHRRDGLDQTFPGDRLREIGGKARFMAP